MKNAFFIKEHEQTAEIKYDFIKFTLFCQIQALSFDLNKDEEDNEVDENDDEESSEEKPDTEMLETKWREKEEPVSIQSSTGHAPI